MKHYKNNDSHRQAIRIFKVQLWIILILLKLLLILGPPG